MNRIACRMLPALTSSQRTSPARIGSPAASADVHVSGRRPLVSRSMIAPLPARGSPSFHTAANSSYSGTCPAARSAHGGRSRPRSGSVRRSGTGLSHSRRRSRTRRGPSRDGARPRRMGGRTRAEVRVQVRGAGGVEPTNDRWLGLPVMADESDADFSDGESRGEPSSPGSALSKQSSSPMSIWGSFSPRCSPSVPTDKSRSPPSCREQGRRFALSDSWSTKVCGRTTSSQSIWEQHSERLLSDMVVEGNTLELTSTSRLGHQPDDQLNSVAPQLST